MAQQYRFNRLELAGSLGDLGTLLPLAIGMILINGLDPGGLFFSIGLYYLLAGLYTGVPVPVQPMKVIAAYAIATGLPASQILAAGALMALFLLLVGASGAVTWIGKHTPKPVVRGVQLTTGVLLMAQGIRFILGTSRFQILRRAAEPFLSLQHLGPVPLGVLIGIPAAAITLLLLENRKFPAGLLVVLGGLVLGFALPGLPPGEALHPGFHLPALLPLGWPPAADFAAALFALVLPQIPMTVGNAVIAYADLSQEYFGPHSRRITYRSAALSMALANILSLIFGGMPLCHGAGGLAAHYRFGARTGGSNVMIGSLFLALALFFGPGALAAVSHLPLSVLGVLLLFAGGQLALSITDLGARKDLFVALLILGITLASSLAWGFIAGLALAMLLRSERFTI